MIKYITYQKKKYPVRLAYRALKMFELDTGVTSDELSTGKGKIEYYETLLFHGLVSGQRAIDKKKEMPFEKDEMIDILDECWLEFLAMFKDFFPEDDKEEGATEGNAPKGNRKERRAGNKSKK